MTAKPKTWRDKSPGEMTGAELRSALYAATGLREPRDETKLEAFFVASSFVLAAKALYDRDLIERYVINLHLGQPCDSGGVRALIEKAIGRAVEAGEPKPLSVSELIREQAERDKRRSLFA